MYRIVYNKHYDLGFWGLERLHSFDIHKYSRAAKLLKTHFGHGWKVRFESPTCEATPDDLQLVHSREYLQEIAEPKNLATALEIPSLRWAPRWLLDRCVMRPMRWAVNGTILAAELALRNGFACNLGGGFHHAKPNSGEGFCIYSDIGIAVEWLRQNGYFDKESRVAYIDIDAHQGNGVCHVFREDRRVFIYDMYVQGIYPQYDGEARDRVDCDVPLPAFCTEAEYLSLMRTKLPGFLDSVGRKKPLALAIVNAGTDVFEGDPLGGLALSAGGIKERDLFVVGECRKRRIPTLMLPSGGYTRESHRLIADSLIAIFEHGDNWPNEAWDELQWLDNVTIQSKKGFVVRRTGRWSLEYREGPHSITFGVEDGCTKADQYIVSIKAYPFPQLSLGDEILSDERREEILRNIRMALEFEGTIPDFR